jgi:hypothetical protein
LPIPHRHLDRPGVAFDVRDTAGAAVPGTRLTVYTVRRPSHSLDTALTWSRLADAVPVALPAVRSRHAVMFFPVDAEAPNRWVWCATAPGHATQIGELGAQDRQLHVTLRPGPTTLTCAPSDTGYREVWRSLPQPAYREPTR